MSDWTYNGTDLFDIPSGSVGFIYVILNNVTGRKYIGQKTLFSKKTRPPLKGNTKKRRSVVDSDWRTYWGSSEELKRDIANLGETNFKRDIMKFCESKSLMNYEETKIQFDLDVLRQPTLYYNGIINCRISRNHILKK